MSAAPTASKTGALFPTRLATVVPVLLVGIVLLMVVPLPALFLDFMLATSIALSVALLLISIHLEKPLDLSSFPTILLFGTLLRLALNVASTRLILLNGSNGTQAAGEVIRSFGEFIVGGNYVVGGTVFVLLVIINFVVITKGAGRVAEVSARFTLDALPGKQMSIDADLASGVLTQEQAKDRRREVEKESDFFGAMDGASKFVRGDAIAGLLMTGINIVVGFVVGVAQNDLAVADAASTYTILTVGDGLASQIPALLVSTAAGVVVTRASAGAALSPTLVRQLGRSRQALYGTAVVLGLIGLLPGMPMLPFLGLAALVAWAARSSGEVAPEDEAGEEATDESAEPTEREKLERMLPVELLELEVGYDLVGLVDAAQGGELVERIGAIRKNLATELGIIVPSVHIRDNLRLSGGAYRLLLSGNEVGHGEIKPARLLAMDPTGSLPKIEGDEVREPAFGLPALWIRKAHREKAEGLGYTVVDPPTVVATHLTELFRSVAPDLLGRGEAQELLDIFARREPRMVDDLVPNVLTLSDVVSVLKRLLSENVSVRDLRSILEALADHGRHTKDPVMLTERVRERLARHITSRFRDDDGRVAALVLDPNAEQAFRDGGPDATAAQRILASLDGASRAFAGVTTPPAVICAPDVRRAVHEFLSRRVPGLSVLSYREIDGTATIRSLGVVSA
ncbi:MAG TPA: flagellar biosynthesis protein FlhA [Sandaracinaceae bacterium LLY-WYZ-13_1]|nr:flagellar biosynthesis protein FlhA [Sandaracinaceae bacterium LLY-WYZ-13_1]